MLLEKALVGRGAPTNSAEGLVRQVVMNFQQNIQPIAKPVDGQNHNREWQQNLYQPRVPITTSHATGKTSQGWSLSANRVHNQEVEMLGRWHTRPRTHA